MKVLVDNNVILDAMLDRSPGFENAKKILKLLHEGNFNGVIGVNSITDIFYIARKYLKKEELYLVLKTIVKTLRVINVGDREILKAIDLNHSDFEDALVSVCASKVKADYIITNDKKFKECLVPKIIPKDFLKKYFPEF